jgi:phthalate 4,5-dioxygenase
MLSQKDNELLCRVGAGTPMGELFRRFWLPALLTSELPESDGPPMRMRILGEDLLAVRNTDGRAGFLNAYCPHKLAALFYGRNEECGLRCSYHGWKFDLDGNCVDMPNNDPTSNYKNKIKIKSYPATEQGGVIWIYMGPADKEPSLPGFEWLDTPDTHRHVSRWLQRTNWCQGVEGEFDNTHVSFLHSWQDLSKFSAYLADVIKYAQADGAAKLYVEQTDYGFLTGSCRKTDTEERFWMFAQWAMPTYSLVGNPGGGWPQGGRIWIPIDDYHTMSFSVTYNAVAPLTEQELASLNTGQVFPPSAEMGPYKLPDGYIIDINQPNATMENNYNIDRAMQRKVNFSGIVGANDQDRSVQEMMPRMPGAEGQIVDRTQEHLIAADAPAATIRWRMLTAAKALAEGEEPTLPHNPECYRIRSPSSTIVDTSDFEEILNRSARAEALID